MSARQDNEAVAVAAPARDLFPYRAFSRSAPRARHGWLVRRLLAAADVVGLVAAFSATEALFSGRSPQIDKVGVSSEIVIFVASLPLWIVLAKLYGLYDRDEERPVYSTVDEVVGVFHLITVAIWIFYGFSWVTGLTSPDQEKLVTFWGLAIGSVIASRAGARALARRHASSLQNTIIIGAGDVGQLIGRKLLQHPEYALRLVGFVDTEPKEARSDLGGLTVLGEPQDLAAIVERHEVDRVIIAFSRDGHEELLDLVRALRGHDVRIDVVPRLFDAVNPRASVHMIEGLALVALTPARMPRSSRFLKRCFDLALALLLLAATAPLMALVALLIRRDSPGPAFFRQVRLGMDKREFTLLKFRTMQVDTDDGPHRDFVRDIMDFRAVTAPRSLYKLPRADRVTRVGRWLRKTSLDELPQLINVVMGDMSLVGPRPCLPYEATLFRPHHNERFLVPAGLTGLWQVEARAHSTFGEALDLDVAYVRGWSFGLDLRLLLRTPLLMIRNRATS
jgi:exopolysaccharide biosynthesis polyprenyl glycosylphosphotransferase